MGEAAKRGHTMNEVFAMVEQDEWVYSDGYSMVCSSFVVAMYKASGMLGDLNIQATEFGPKDLTMMNVFKPSYDRPQACIDADPDLPYCQILGKYRMALHGISSINLYNHMNEDCPSIAPQFLRPDGCWSSIIKV